MTREEWLLTSAKLMADLVFKPAGLTMPKFRVSVGVPYGHRLLNKAIGQHWHPRSSEDGVSTIFISPIINDAVEVQATLAHEIVHALYPDDGHGKLFGTAARAIGLDGKLTATRAGTDLAKVLQQIASMIGPYPHARLITREQTPRKGPATPEPKVGPGGIKKQGTRMIKMECKTCGYIARTSRANIEKHGAVICPCNGEAMSVG